MKNIHSKYHWLIILMMLNLISGCRGHQRSADIDLKEKKEPEVKQPTVDLEISSPVPGEETPVSDLRQDTSRFTYQISIDNKKALDTVMVKGIADEITTGKLLLKTEQGQSAQMQYFLPGNQELEIVKGDVISISSIDNIKGASFNRLLHLENNRGTVVSYGIQTGSSPVQITINKSLLLQQSAFNEKDIISDSKYNTHYKAPVSLVIAGKRNSIEHKKEFYFEYNKARYKLMVALSSYSVPKKEFEAVSEGRGYFIEYLLLLLK